MAPDGGGSRSSVAIGPTRSGSSPAASSTERANSYHETAPWLVTWNRPVRRPTTRRWTALARSSAKVGCPIWSSTNASRRPVPGQAQDGLHHVVAVEPAHPRGPDDRGVAVQLVLAAQLRAAVHRLRGWGIPLVVGRGLRAVEDVVGRHGTPERHRLGRAPSTNRAPSALTRNARSGRPRRHRRPSRRRRGPRHRAGS